MKFWNGFALIALVYGSPQGFASNQSPGIVYGANANLTMVPWQVSLQYSEIPGGLHFCGGAILSKRLILTAGHCIDPKHPFYVKAGGDGSLAQLQMLPAVKTVTIHPKYNDDTFNETGYDIAMVELASDIEFSDSVNTIALPEKNKLEIDEVLAHPEDILISGWGHTQTGEAATQLQFLQGFTFMISQTANAPFLGFEISHHRSSCEGDSGGPMVMMNTKTLIGLSSHGNVDNCLARTAFYYTNLHPYLSWVYSFFSR